MFLISDLKSYIVGPTTNGYLIVNPPFYIDVHEPTAKYIMELAKHRAEIITFNPFWRYFLNFTVEAVKKIN